jgi:hypothetical protein
MHFDFYPKTLLSFLSLAMAGVLPATGSIISAAILPEAITAGTPAPG